MRGACVPGGGGVDRAAKISNLQLPIGPRPQQQILWFDIPVNHLLGVAVVEGICHLHDVLEDKCGRNKTKRLIQGCAQRKLENKTTH